VRDVIAGRVPPFGAPSPSVAPGAGQEVDVTDAGHKTLKTEPHSLSAVRRPTYRSELRRLYESNIAGARMVGAQWAVYHYQSAIRHLDEHPRGPLTGWMKRDVARFGRLIRV